MIICGVDIGTRQDYTAITWLDGWSLTRIEQLPLGLEYPDLIQRLRPIIRQADHSYLDASGVGRPVFDSLKQTCRNLTGISITSGKQANISENVWTVPKPLLMDALFQALNRGVLKITAPDPGRSLLRDEMVHFMRDGNQSGAANGKHDDLVLAAALACFGKGAGHGLGENVIPFRRKA